VSPVECIGGKRSLRAYIAVCLQIHCNLSSSLLSSLFNFTKKLKCKLPKQIPASAVVQNFGVFEGNKNKNPKQRPQQITSSSTSLYVILLLT